MKRIAATICVVGLVAAGLVLTLWVRGLWRHDRVIWRVGAYRNHAIGSDAGTVYWMRQKGPWAAEEQAQKPQWRSESPERPVALGILFPPPFRSFLWHRLDGDLDAPPGDQFSSEEVWSVADWAIVFCLLLPSLLRLNAGVRANRRGAQRRRAGRCVTCNYDLRGTPDV